MVEDFGWWSAGRRTGWVVEAEHPLARPIGEVASRVEATGALSWIGTGFQGRATSSTKRGDTDTSLKRTRGALVGPPVGFGLEGVALGDFPAGSDPAFEKRLRKRCERSSITLRKSPRRKGHGNSASDKTPRVVGAGDMSGVKKDLLTNY